MAVPATVELDRPLRLGELLATALRIFSLRPWPYVGIGAVEGLAFLAANTVHWAVGLVILSVSFAAALGFVVRIVLGDQPAPAWRRVAAAAPILLSLALVVAVPFYLGSLLGLLLLVFSAGWLGLTAFAIPAVMAEDARDPGWLGRTAYALRRTTELARIEYVHAAGVAAALIVVYVLVSIALSAALSGYADNSRLVAQALAQIVLAPFFFIGLSVLYFDQKARAVESAGRPGKRR